MLSVIKQYSGFMYWCMHNSWLAIMIGLEQSTCQHVFIHSSKGGEEEGKKNSVLESFSSRKSRWKTRIFPGWCFRRRKCKPLWYQKDSNNFNKKGFNPLRELSNLLLQGYLPSQLSYWTLIINPGYRNSYRRICVQNFIFFPYFSSVRRKAQLMEQKYFSRLARRETFLIKLPEAK